MKATRPKAAKQQTKSHPKRVVKRPLSLYPLSFDEAVADILKVKPEPKPRKKTKK
jgi:hypothetical protein